MCLMTQQVPWVSTSKSIKVMAHSKMNRKQPKFNNSRSGNQLNSSKKHGTGKGNWGDVMNDCDDPDFFSSNKYHPKHSTEKVIVSPIQRSFA